MSRKGEYSDKYGFHVSNLVFDCGGESIARASRGGLTTEGIDGAQPRRYTAERARPAPCEDAPTTAGTTRRKLPSQPRNPLDPQYNLPAAPESPIDPPKFIRDQMDVSDIDGAKRKERRQLQKPTTSLQTGDIEGGRPRQGTAMAAQRAPRTAGLDVSDIAGKGEARAQAAKGQAKAKADHRELTPEVVKSVEEGVGKQENLEW